MAKTAKPGRRPPRSVEYEITGPRGGNKKRLTVLRSSLAPPSDTLRTKSGRVIFTSPAKSATTHVSWSRAFKQT
jgi:hypothetical protein